MFNLPVELTPRHDDDHSMGPKEAQAFLGLTKQTFWRGVKSGYIPAPSYPAPKSPRWTRGELRRHRELSRRRAGEAKELRRKTRLAREAAQTAVALILFFVIPAATLLTT